MTACPPCNQRKGVNYWEPLSIEAALRVEKIRRTRNTDTVATEHADPNRGNLTTHKLTSLRERAKRPDPRRLNGLS